MKGTLRKFGPTATVAAVLIYICWPFLGGSTPWVPDAVKKTPEIAANLLTLPPLSPPDRDPFRAPPADKQAGDASVAAAAEPETRDAITAGDAPEPAADAARAALPIDLVLNATYLRQNYRAALINGRLYVPGDRLRELEAAHGELVIRDIQPHRVLIHYRGQDLHLDYDLSASAGDSP